MHVPGFLNKNLFKSKSLSRTEAVKGDGEKREKIWKRFGEAEREMQGKRDLTRKRDTGRHGALAQQGIKFS